MKENKKIENKRAFESLDILIGRWKEGTFPEMIDDWKWILRYSARYKGAITFYTLLGIVSTSFGLVSSVAGKYMIDIITGYQMDKLATLSFIMVGSALFSLIFDNVIKRLSTKISLSIHNDIQADVYDKVIDADWIEINRFSNGDLLNRINGDVSTISSNAVSWIPTVVIAIYRFVATFLVILHYDVIMACIALLSAPVMLFASRYLVKKQQEYSRKVRETSSELMSFEVESFYNIDTMKSFGITERYGKKMRTLQAKFKEISLKYNLFTIQTNVLIAVMGHIIQFISFGYCLYRLWTKDITYGTMTLFLQQRSNLSNAFNNVVSIIPSFLSCSVSARRIREIYDLPKEVHIPESAKLDAYAEDGFEVYMRNVEFSYVEDKKVLMGSGFCAAPGEIVALVGPSGEGKTTMIRLMLGLLHPQNGEVGLTASNGENVTMNVETRHLFAYVPQGNTIISGTVAENLRMVKEEATDEEICEVLKISCAWDFVSKMPEGIHSSVGERGKGLSEGQAQRIAIARAILKDAPILLMDEATSALDVATERSILRNIVTQKPNKTCIVTTHRPSVLSMCQRVYRIQDTKLQELGQEEAQKMSVDF